MFVRVPARFFATWGRKALRARGVGGVGEMQPSKQLLAVVRG